MRRNIKNAKRQHPKRRWCNDRQRAKQQALQICSAIGSDNIEDMARVLPHMPQDDRQAIVDHAKRLNFSRQNERITNER